jgi:glutamate dehydrogenase (NADP+)
MDLKNNRRGRISEYADHYKVKFYESKRPWQIPCQLAFPCATQNELDENDAKELIKHDCIAIAEGANMPTTLEALEVIQSSGIMFAPGKAANAGGVAVSGLEMTQNSIRMAWSFDELEVRLRDIMVEIHRQCVKYGSEKDRINYVKGANIAGFVKVADAMLAEGII